MFFSVLQIFWPRFCTEQTQLSVTGVTCRTKSRVFNLNIHTRAHIAAYLHGLTFMHSLVMLQFPLGGKFFCTAIKSTTISKRKKVCNANISQYFFFFFLTVYAVHRFTEKAEDLHVQTCELLICFSCWNPSRTPHDHTSKKSTSERLFQINCTINKKQRGFALPDIVFPVAGGLAPGGWRWRRPRSILQSHIWTAEKSFETLVKCIL